MIRPSVCLSLAVDYFVKHPVATTERLRNTNALHLYDTSLNSSLVSSASIVYDKYTIEYISNNILYGSIKSRDEQNFYQRNVN